MPYPIKRVLLVVTFFAAFVSGCSLVHRDSVAAQNAQPRTTARAIAQDQKVTAVAVMVKAAKANLRDKTSLRQTF